MNKTLEPTNPHIQMHLYTSTQQVLLAPSTCEVKFASVAHVVSVLSCIMQQSALHLLHVFDICSILKQQMNSYSL